MLSGNALGWILQFLPSGSPLILAIPVFPCPYRCREHILSAMTHHSRDIRPALLTHSLRFAPALGATLLR